MLTRENEKRARGGKRILGTYIRDAAQQNLCQFSRQRHWNVTRALSKSIGTRFLGYEINKPVSRVGVGGEGWKCWVGEKGRGLESGLDTYL